jgi:uncharacterized protein YyaL (SSP411 family)
MAKPNRLAKEASPYLLQHAHNPVDWWPWCAEALELARSTDRPILLSIGYSACHWCHVMERESFEDSAIAELMNSLFVCIKVDREERPDLDQIYQLTVQLMGRSGGWPLTVFLTPAQKPFYAGTYFPPEERHGMPGFPRILRALAEAYRTERDSVEAQARELTAAIASVGGQEGDAYTPGPDLLSRVSSKLLERWDAAQGGFGKAPKFPNTMPLELLMRAGHSKEATQQLLSMRWGGIWDHLGGGFHRYSTDREWLVPHFEKMLYDNALLLRTYLDASRAYDEPAFAGVARDIAKYIEREMTDPDGGFYASQDADSEGMEGAFFVWSPADVEAALGGDAPRAMEHFGITMAGNMGSTTFKTVLSAVKDGDVGELKERMFAWREKRPKPFRDEKVLTSWSSLMISALAEAGMALKEPAFLSMAERAFAFLLLHCVEGGRVSRLAKKIDGKWQVKKPGFLDDHAFLANAALDLYEATGTAEYVTVARSIADAMLVAFDGFAFTPNDGEKLITRSKDPFDNAIPSGASMAYRALLRLGALLGGEYTRVAETELTKLASAAVHNPFAYGQSLCELDRVIRGSVDIVIVGAKSDPRTQALIHAVYNSWLANRSVAWVDPAGITAAPALAEGKPARAEPVAYVCRGRACSLPVTTPSELLPLLR